MHRRYEILLPLRFNDGRRVPDELIAGTILDLRARFGAVSSESQVIHGTWQHQTEVFRDELMRVFIDVEDTTDNRTFFVSLKQRLKSQFQQLDIWLTSYPVDVL